MKNILEAPFLVEMVRTTTNMYAHGWDERNGGNIIVNTLEKQQRGRHQRNQDERVWNRGSVSTRPRKSR